MDQEAEEPLVQEKTYASVTDQKRGGDLMAKQPSGGRKTNLRNMRTKVKTARGRKLSSTLWLERQLNDPYVQRAQREGYRGRAAFKIMEIDDKHRFLVPGARVVDLGAAPGGWCQVAVKRVNALGEKSGKAVGTILGIDLQDFTPSRILEDFIVDQLPVVQCVDTGEILTQRAPVQWLAYPL